GRQTGDRARHADDRPQPRAARPQRSGPVVHLPTHVGRHAGHAVAPMDTARPLVNAAETILPRVPARAQGAIAESIGTLAYLSAPRARAAVAANLAVVAPGRTDLIRKVFVNQVLQYLEVFTIP